jgi:serine/threonine-protein kinase HipA
LSIARRLGLPAAASEVRRFDDEVAIVVTRYDRLWDDDAQRFRRIHQEDMCQALGVRPMWKYQNEGGPGPVEIAGLLRTHSSRAAEDIETFVDALVLNWLIAGTDAHAKNYAVLHGAGGRLRLAPLYDVASALPYERLVREKLKLAMKVGGTYRLREVGRKRWEKLARELAIAPDALVDRIREVMAAMPDVVSDVRARCRDEGLTHTLIDTLATETVRHVRECASTF